MNMYKDVQAFYRKFKFPEMAVPTPLHRLPDGLGRERLRHLKEELDELTLATTVGDLASQADALADLVYIALGTAHIMGLPWGGIWEAVQVANMKKVAAEGSRKHVAKPAGWEDPIAQIEALIARRRNLQMEA